MDPILTIRQREPEKKLRIVRVPLVEVYKDADALTYKYVDGRAVENPQAANAIQSDSTENLDGHILARSVQFRNAMLRRLMLFALAEETDDYVTSDLKDKKYAVYKLRLSASFNDALLEDLAAMFHRFLLYGALFDWYGAALGDKQYQIYKEELKELEDQILNLLRTPSRAKRPMQPFGPAHRKTIL